MSPLSAQGSDGVSCPLCGETADRPHTERGESWVCSPCRAEHAGVVVLRIPAKALPPAVVEAAGSARFMGNRRSANLALGAWAHRLQLVLEEVRAVRAALDAAPDTEAVAHAVMGTDADPQLREVQGDGLALEVSGLPALLARRLVKTTFAKGPSLSSDAMSALIREATP